MPLGVIHAHGDCRDAVLPATFREPDMERSIFTLKPAMQGWQLVDQETVNHWYPDQLAALISANCMSFARYRATGIPTGVKVQMACGDWVMVGMHG